MTREEMMARHDGDPSRGPRVAVSGWSPDGAAIVGADDSASWADTHAGTRIAPLWHRQRAESDIMIPARADYPPVGMPGVIPSNPGDISVVMAWFAPDAERSTFGMHRTASIDVVTVIEGELVVQMEDGEVTVRELETFVQNAGVHAVWNRTSQMALAVITMVGVEVSG
jgi:quercetin dioxygenase-like cupin family protein